MKTNIFNARHHAKTGPGGWFCPCCAPSPGHERKVVARNHKRKVYRILEKLDRAEMASA